MSLSSGLGLPARKNTLGSDDGLRRQETKEILQRVAQALHLVDLDVLRQGVVLCHHWRRGSNTL